MRWNFWKKSNDQQIQEETETPETNVPEPKDNNEDNKTTSHEVLNTQIDALIADTLAYIKPISDEIQINRGNSNHINGWIAQTDNLVKTVLSYAKEGEYPSQKTLMYSDIYGSAVQIDSREGQQYKERLEKFMEENRPEDGIIKNITWFKGKDAESIVAKQKFLEEFRLQTQAIRADADKELSKSVQEVTVAKSEAIHSLTKLFQFYERLEEAIKERDLDAMLDVSNDRIDNVVNKILNVNWQEIEEEKEAKAMIELVKAMNVYDELIDLAANVTTKNGAHRVLKKILADVTTPERVISFTENVLQQLDQGQNPIAHKAYSEFLNNYIGDTIKTDKNSYLRYDKLISAVFSNDFKTLTVMTHGGNSKPSATNVTFEDPFVAAAYYRILSSKSNMHDFEKNSKELINVDCIKAIRTFQNPEDAEQKISSIYVDTDDSGWSEIDCDDCATTLVDFEGLKKTVNGRSNITVIDDTLSLDINDLIALRLDQDTRTLSYAVRCSNYSPRWYRHELTDTMSFAKLLQSEAFSQFITGPDGYSYNTENLRLIQSIDIHEDDYRNINYIDINECEKEFFGESTPLQVDISDASDAIQTLNIDDIINNIDEFIDQLTDDNETEIESDQDKKTTTEVTYAVRLSIASNNTVADNTELDQSIKFTVPFTSKAARTRFLSKLKSQSQMVELNKSILVNANTLDYTVARYSEFELTAEEQIPDNSEDITSIENSGIETTDLYETIDLDELFENAFLTEPETALKPSIKLYFNDLADQPVGPIEVSHDTMKSISDELSKASDTVIHRAQNVHDNDFTSVTINKGNIALIQSGKTETDEPANDDTQEETNNNTLVDITYGFKTLASTKSMVGLTETANEEAPNPRRIASELGLLVVKDEGEGTDYIEAINGQEIVSIKGTGKNRLEIAYASGPTGTLTTSFSAENNKIARNDLLASISTTGYTKTILSPKRR